MNKTDDIALNLGEAMDEGVPPLVIQPAPGFLRFAPPLIKQIAALGGQLRMGPDGSLWIEGFYKNGPMKLDFDENDILFAIDKRERKTAIAHFDDLVLLNFSWWRASNTKKNEYILPEQPWLHHFIEKKWVKRKIIFEPIDSSVSDDLDS